MNCGDWAPGLQFGLVGSLRSTLRRADPGPKQSRFSGSRARGHHRGAGNSRPCGCCAQPPQDHRKSCSSPGPESASDPGHNNAWRPQEHAQSRTGQTKSQRFDPSPKHSTDAPDTPCAEHSPKSPDETVSSASPENDMRRPHTTWFRRPEAADRAPGCRARCPLSPSGGARTPPCPHPHEPGSHRRSSCGPGCPASHEAQPPHH